MNEQTRQEWHEIAVTLPREGSDWISHLLFEIGSIGNLEEDCPDPAAIAMKGYFPTEIGPSTAIIQQITELLREKGISPLSTYSATLKLQNWAENAEQMFSPIKILKDTTVVNPWSKYVPRPGEKTVVINPGMAFGTGLHATTQLAASLMDEVIAKLTPPHPRPLRLACPLAELARQAGEAWPARSPTRPPCYARRSGRGLRGRRAKHGGRANPLPNGEREQFTMCDVGCGSAILSIIAAVKGVGYIEAVEIDADARKSAEENIRRNNVGHCIRLVPHINQAGRSFDLVVANILYATIIDLKENLIGCVKNGGRLVLSGITAEEDEKFRKNFNDPRIELISRRMQDNWMGYLYAAVHD